MPALAATAVVALDQATKAGVVAWLGPDRERHRSELLGAVFAVEYVENTGAAFGSFRGQGLPLIAFALAIVVGLVFYYRRITRQSAPVAFAVGLLIGGAIGNLVDRVRLGHVVDFVAVGIWPKFNVADAAVAVGIILLAWHVLVADPGAGGIEEARDLKDGNG